jgi:DNA ligase-1
MYSTLAEFYKKLDSTTKRLEMIDILIELFKQTPPDEIRVVMYLTTGRLGADYEAMEIGLADKTILKAIAKFVGKSETEVEHLFNRKGDLGEVIEILKGKSEQQNLDTFFGGTKTKEELRVFYVWQTLIKMLEIEGKGATSRKINLLLDLYSKASPNEAKFLTRTVLAKLRLGVKDLTIIEALARTYGKGENARELIEHAYNITSDIGKVAEILVKEGMEGIEKIRINVGIPIRMMAAQRMPTTEEILEKLGGNCALEFKYDGERVQAHISKDSIKLFSRNLNEISEMYPDVQSLLKRHLNSNDTIIEGEIVAWDKNEEEMKPFQVLMSRKRKYDIKEAIERVPVKIFLFDILYLDGESLLKKSYPDRRSILESIVKENTNLVPSNRTVVNNVGEFEDFFELAIERGCEGVMAKDIRKETPYQAGNRGFLWIKHKFDYTSGFADSYDFVIVGGFFGKGRRKGTIGTVLMAAYNPEEERFETVCKLGSGFKDEDLINLTKELMDMKIDEKPKDVFSKMEAEIWFQPTKVLEIKGADLSTSPTHTCALDIIKKDVGIAIRFPRFVRFRDDKKSELATTTREVIDAYKSQKLIDSQNETDNN